MSSRFTLQKPYVVATLPRPIDPSNGRYMVGEVYGGAPGSKKRKRSELAVGINGEGVNLYDVSASRLITSYALPPQSTFTCPPASLRTRISKFKIERRTYVATTGPIAQINSFHSIIDGDSGTQTQENKRKIEGSQSPVVFLDTITAVRGTENTNGTSDVVTVKKDGEIQCYDGDDLREKWTSPSSALFRDNAFPVKNSQVEYAHLTNAYSASQGLLKGRQDIFSLFPQDITEDGFNPDLLLLVTRSGKKLRTRTLHLVSFPRRSAMTTSSARHSVESLIAVNIPYPSRDDELEDILTFSIQSSAGILQQLDNDILTTFDITNTIPKEQSSLKISDAQSFLRLSNTSIMISAGSSISVYNPKYNSKLATVDLDLISSPLSSPLKRKRIDYDETNGFLKHQCQLISYFPKLGIAMAIVDNSLIGVQIEGQRYRNGKPSVTGLLIDSLGRSVGQPLEKSKGPPKTNFLTLEPLMTAGASEKPWQTLLSPIEKAFAAENCTEADFDRLMAPYLGPDWVETTSEDNDSKNPVFLNKNMVNGVGSFQGQPEEIDRRWAVYAMSKIFTLLETNEGPKLSVSFYPPNTFMWLIQSGYMSIANIESALRYEDKLPKGIPSGQLVRILSDLDPEMEMLIAVIEKSHLGAAELLHAILKLMDSLGVMIETPETTLRLLTNGGDEELETMNDDIDEQVERLEQEVAQDIALAEFHLGPGSGMRGQGLSLALSQLYKCPDESIVRALQTTYNSEDMNRLIYLLRFELIRGSWTLRYTDDSPIETFDYNIDTPDNTIILISNLLNCCVDAIGAGGWLSGEARLVNGDIFEAEDLISGLKLEVSAALEGIEEAVYFKGLFSEFIRFGDSVQKQLAATNSSNNPDIKPISLAQDSHNLPLGLKADKQVSFWKIDAGGEMKKRKPRDIGDKKSRKVGKYSRERIEI